MMDEARLVPSPQELLTTLSDVHTFLTGVDAFPRPLHALQILYAECEPNGFVRAELQVEKEHCNLVHVLHVAMATLIVDVIGHLACYAEYRKAGGEEFWKMATTGEMSTSNLRPALLGEIIVIEARCLKAGQGLCFASVEIFRKSDGLVVATGRHTMYLTSRL